MINIYEGIEKNKRKSAIVTFFFFIFVSFSTYFLSLAFGYNQNQALFLAFVISFLSSFLSYWYSDKIILTISKARPANQEEDRIFRQVAENLSIAAQVPLPKLYVIEDSAPNAFATGRNTSHAVICVTTGLLQKLTRTELEGVIAHEISHIKNYDTLLMTVVSVMVGIIALLSDWLLRSGFRFRKKEDKDNNLFAILALIGLILAIFSPLIAQLIQLAISRRREFLADAGSAYLTRQPSGLISALKKISSDPETLEAANKATAHLYIVSPLKGKNYSNNWLNKLFNTHPPIEERIKALEKML